MKGLWFFVFVAVGMVFGATSGPSFAQQAPLEPPRLFQPAPAHTLVVSANVPLIGLNFDWADVPGATSYELEVARQGAGSDRVVTEISHALYQSVIVPLEPGTFAEPNLYQWIVTPFQNGVRGSQSSEVFTFGLASGASIGFATTSEGAPPPQNLTPNQNDLLTLPLLSKEGLFMEWSPVPEAVGYEIQLVFVANLQGAPIGQLIYRMNVTEPHALTTNLTTGRFRFDVRAIASGGIRGNPSSQSFRIVEDFLDVNRDSSVDGLDLLGFSKDWFQACQDLDEDFIRDTLVDQRELLSFLIRLTNSDQRFPAARPSPPPLPSLAKANLIEPASNQPIVLNSTQETVLFDWDPVADAEEYELILRNLTAETFQCVPISNPNVTQFSVPAQTFAVPLGGSGNYTWSVIGKGACFSDTESDRRPFEVEVNFDFSPKEERAPVSPTPEQTRLGWASQLKGFFLGAPVEAGTVPSVTDLEILEAPEILFPRRRQCLQIGPTFSLVWREVPGVESYAVQFFFQFPQGNLTQSIPLSEEFENGISIVRDDVPGDGIVQVQTGPTFPSQYFLRVAARVGEVQGKFSNRVFFTLSNNCLSFNFPFIDIDFNGDRKFNGPDILIFAGQWHSIETGPLFDKRADLSPAGGDDFIGPRDLLAYLSLFRIRDLLPKSPPLDPPEQQTPRENAKLFFNSESAGNVLFSYIPPATNELAEPFIYEIEVRRPDGITRFFSLEAFAQVPFLNNGTFRWRVRAIADDGTFGRWSPFRSFEFVQTSLTLPAVKLFSPRDDETLSAGPIVFVASRSRQINPDRCIFHRFEIYNGEIFSASFDAYLLAGETGRPTVAVTLPLYPNYGPNFRWTVIPFEELTDSNRDIFQLPGETTGTLSFKVEGAGKTVSGLAAWNGDVNLDGAVNFKDYLDEEAGWYLTRDDTSDFTLERDLDFSGRYDSRDLHLLAEARILGKGPITNGIPPSFQIFPREPDMGNPQIITLLEASRGATLNWFDFNADRYLVEWVDDKHQFRATYATRLAPPAKIKPASGDIIQLASLDDRITFVWGVLPDAQEYELQIQAVSNGQGVVERLEAGPPTDATFSHSISGRRIFQGLLNLPLDNRYRFFIAPKACGHFFQLDVLDSNEFTLIFPETVKNPEVPLEKGSEPKQSLPLLNGRQARIPATQPGLHFWRVTPMGPDFSLGDPSPWQRFGIGTLGPGFN